MPHHNDLQLHNYQDDLDTDPNKTDPLIHEQTDEPAGMLNEPQAKLKADLGVTALDDLGRSGGDPQKEDLREHVEDMDEADKSDR